MAKKDINKQPFTEATMLKLDIFRRCFREWFPVFVHHPSVKHIFIYDMFAGSGTDSEGNPGSPIILLEEAKGNERQHCVTLANNNKSMLSLALMKKKKGNYLIKLKTISS